MGGTHKTKKGRPPAVAAKAGAIAKGEEQLFGPRPSRGGMKLEDQLPIGPPRAPQILDIFGLFVRGRRAD